MHLSSVNFIVYKFCFNKDVKNVGDKLFTVRKTMLLHRSLFPFFFFFYLPLLWTMFLKLCRAHDSPGDLEILGDSFWAGKWDSAFTCFQRMPMFLVWEPCFCRKCLVVSTFLTCKDYLTSRSRNIHRFSQQLSKWKEPI